jgi:hypothetical protein
MGAGQRRWRQATAVADASTFEPVRDALPLANLSIATAGIIGSTLRPCDSRSDATASAYERPEGISVDLSALRDVLCEGHSIMSSGWGKPDLKDTG